MTRLLLLVVLLLVSFWSRAADEELLEPEKAFKFSARMVKPDLIEGQFRVAKGYYLYKKKMKFSAQGAKLGKASLPAGKMKKDEVYGRVEVYPQDTRVRIPVSGANKSFTLKAVFQGCAELGVCYPPQETAIKLTPPEKKKDAKTDKTDKAESDRPAKETAMQQYVDFVGQLKAKYG